MTIFLELSEKEIETMVAKKTPSDRQAYSDRTSWIMACISELTYLKFDPFRPERIIGYLINRFPKLITKNKEEILSEVMEKINYDPKVQKEILEQDLKLINFKLHKTFDNNGTQAILVENEKYIVLAFRGTEATSIKDIKSDMNTVITECEGGGKIHSGFEEAYKQVASDIEQSLGEESLQNKPLFITGHSLGGALATIAAKKITHKGGNAGCYTFGSPRVGDEDWISSIKTPLYRVVNAADCVTMLPPGDGIITMIAFLLGLIPKVGDRINTWLLSKFGGYLHAGDMKYMTNCPKNNYKDVKLLYSVSWFYKIKQWWKKKALWRSFLADHSISVYRKKLWTIAYRRNP